MQTTPGVLLHHACISSTGSMKAEKFHRELGQNCCFTTTDAMAIFRIFTRKFDKVPTRRFSCKNVLFIFTMVLLPTAGQSNVK